MSRLIDVDELISTLKSTQRLFERLYDRKAEIIDTSEKLNYLKAASTLDTFVELLEDAPTIDPTPHGYWEGRGRFDVGGEVYEAANCSICGQEITINEYDNYCPNCGAKMDGDSE